MRPHRSPLILPVLGSLAFAGCATKPAPTPAPVVQIALTPTLETSPCLRGTLPEADGLTVGGVMTFGAEQLGGRLCERERGDQLVRVIDDFNKAQAPK